MKLEEIKYGISGIYKIVFDNNKIYIGLSNDIRRRMLEHLNKDCNEHPELLLSKAIKKHNIINIEILEEIDPENRQLLQERERYWISYYNSFLDKTKGYNLTPGGDGANCGTYNAASYLTENDINSIISLLLNSDLTYNEISEKIGCSYSIVSRINNGLHYKKDNYDYPLREKRKNRIGIKNKTSAFYNCPEKLFKIIVDLKENNLSQQDICKKYNIGRSLLNNINSGQQYFQPNEKYPLRPFRSNCSHKRIFSEDEMNYIKESLEKKIPMKTIAEQLHCDRKVISDINKGKRQKQENWTYPLKK